MNHRIRAEICPSCGVLFKAAQKYGPDGIGTGKTCPNGHYTSMHLFYKARTEARSAYWQNFAVSQYYLGLQRGMEEAAQECELLSPADAAHCARAIRALAAGESAGAPFKGKP